MKTLYMTVGLPASGKTTWVLDKLKESPGAYKRVNKDDLRAMLDGGKWSRDNEKFVLSVRDGIIESALGSGKHVIVDDTNLAPKHEERLRQLAKQHGAAFEIVDFTHIAVEECIERDRKRQNYVGEKVIRDMWRQFLAPKLPVVAYDPDLEDCILIDIDGTSGIMNGRGPFEWTRVGEDLPNRPVSDLLRMLTCVPETEWIFVSGRDECCRVETELWLARHFGTDRPSSPFLALFMRPVDDMRDDRIVKREIYEREIQGKYNVLFVLDDRNKVVEQWRAMGLPCFQVAEGNF
jgi:predicted kinase